MLEQSGDGLLADAVFEAETARALVCDSLSQDAAARRAARHALAVAPPAEEWPNAFPPFHERLRRIAGETPDNR